MGDIYVENYKKGVQRAVERWAAKVAKITAELKKIDERVAELEEIKDPSAEEKKELDKLYKDRKACRDRMDKAAMELKLDLMLLEVDAKADQKEVIKLPPWIKEIVKKGGIPVTENVTITPDVDFDLKSKKLKKFGVTFKWEF